MKTKNKKQKAKIFSGFFYAIKTVSKIDKFFVFQKAIYAVLSAINSFTFPYIIKVAVEKIETNRPLEELIREVFIYSLIAFAINVFFKILDPIFWYKGDRIASILKHQKSLRTLEMDYELLERPETQDASEKASQNIGNWRGPLGIINRGFNSLQYVISFLIASTIVLLVNHWLIIAIFILAIFKAFLENNNQRREKAEFYDQTPPLWRKINYTYSITTNMTIGKDLRVYNMDKAISEVREDSVNEFKNLANKNFKRRIFFYSLIRVLTVLDAVLLYGFMIYEVLYNGMPIANFTFMISSVFTLSSSLHNIIYFNADILRVSLETQDYRKFMEMDYIRENETEDIDFETVEVEFQNVYYSYYLQEGYALEDVSFKLNKNEKLALVGYNGAGKTTLVKLLSGLYHPTKGRILINGVDIENINRDSLQKIISPVFQDSMIYAFEVAENVGMQISEKVDYEQVEDILKLVELDKKINSLPLKVKTTITRELDETGIELSGGEAQKLALARSIYKNAPLFILDEPTSALDPLSESHMYNNFNKIINNNSAIFISHRLSSTKFCDRIIFLADGKVKEIGTHQELINIDGEYKKLFNTQADYYKTEETNEN